MIKASIAKSAAAFINLSRIERTKSVRLFIPQSLREFLSNTGLVYYNELVAMHQTLSAHAQRQPSAITQTAGSVLNDLLGAKEGAEQKRHASPSRH